MLFLHHELESFRHVAQNKGNIFYYSCEFWRRRYSSSIGHTITLEYRLNFPINLSKKYPIISGVTNNYILEQLMNHKAF